MTVQEFVNRYKSEAIAVQKKYGLNPIATLAQAAQESGWGNSYSAINRKNLFGFTAGGSKNEYWSGAYSVSSASGLKFRIYTNTLNSFLDYGRLITSKYKNAASQKTVEGFAAAISQSPYISEANGDNREAYRKGIISHAQKISAVWKNAPISQPLTENNTLKYIGLGFGLLVLLSLTKPAPPKKEPKYIIVKEV